MTEEMEKIIDLHYEDSIELPENKLLYFKRIVNYKCTYRQAVKISIEDLENGMTIELGTYFDATWKFSSPMNERIFWQNVKSNMLKFKEVFDRLRLPIPTSKEVHAYHIISKKVSMNTSNHFNKFLNIFKGSHV